LDGYSVAAAIGGSATVTSTGIRSLFLFLRSRNQEDNWTARTKLVCEKIGDDADLSAALDAVRPAIDYRIRDHSTPAPQQDA
jgi:hypothetical protein